MKNLSQEELFNERQKLDELKQELEEKNKQMWSMSETVYKEKKKIETELNIILKEKSELIAQKNENNEKVKMLWEQSTAIHKEKERIEKLKTEIEYRHREMVDSVNYAKRIQEAILPELAEINTAFPNSFVLFKPKDIVSGDFFWFDIKEDKVFIAAADCTGHGVPGALMSMLGTDKLNNALENTSEADKLLADLNRGVKKVLKQSGKEDSTRDGMDIALCVFNRELNQMEYAGANRPCWIIRNGQNEVEEIKGTKTAIGGHTEDDQEFSRHQFKLLKGDLIYIFSDGYADQFSSSDKKLMTRKFKEILLSNSSKAMSEQKEFLDHFIENWRGNMEQTDDILVIGIKI
jgi:serine phosphatase RsbU (regulator of sigma subunit)